MLLLHDLDTSDFTVWCGCSQLHSDHFGVCFSHMCVCVCVCVCVRARNTFISSLSPSTHCTAYPRNLISSLDFMSLGSNFFYQFSHESLIFGKLVSIHLWDIKNPSSNMCADLEGTGGGVASSWHRGTDPCRQIVCETPSVVLHAS
jgi:hypothetical protein